MLKVSVVLNLFIGIFWGSGLLLSDKNVEAKLALPIPMLYISLSKLSIVSFGSFAFRVLNGLSYWPHISALVL